LPNATLLAAGQIEAERMERARVAVTGGVFRQPNNTLRLQLIVRQRKEIILGHNRVSRNRRILRNVFMASALATVLSAGANIRPASAHTHHSVTAREGKHAHNAVGIGETGAWRHEHHQRSGMREKLLSSSQPPERHADRSTESVHPFEGSGIASVYSDQHTASGEHMNSGAMTAAHRTLPFGTKVTVVNHSNGRSAVVRINDRGPFVHGRVIDLSPAAARVLGIDGLTTVSLTTQPKAHRPGWLESPRPM
jgi:rare lipoprotein A